MRNLFGYVMQEPSLMSCTIKENILYGNPKSLDSEIYFATVCSNSLEFLINKKLKSPSISEPRS